VFNGCFEPESAKFVERSYRDKCSFADLTNTRLHYVHRAFEEDDRRRFFAGSSITVVLNWAAGPSA
jgi:hypothetical protein